MDDYPQGTPIQVRFPASDLTDEDLDLICFVRDYRREHDVGPTWREVAAHLGWNWSSTPRPPEHEKSADQRRGEERIRYLLHGWWLTRTGDSRKCEPRSLAISRRSWRLLRRLGLIEEAAA